jgi:hypothetical protein
MRIAALVVALLVAVMLGQICAQAASVYVLSSGNAGIDNTVKTRLEGFGHTVVIGVQYFQFDGTQDLTGIDTVYLQANANWSAGDIPLAGQTALVNYVGGGGGLVTCEWVVWKAAIGGLQILETALPAAPASGYRYTSPVTYTQATPDPILNAGVPPVLTFPVDSYAGTEVILNPRAGAIAYYSSDYPGGSQGVVGWTYGGGRALCFSTTNGPTQLSDPAYGQLFSNAMTWAAVPEPTMIGVMALGVLALASRRRRG